VFVRCVEVHAICIEANAGTPAIPLAFFDSDGEAIKQIIADMCFIIRPKQDIEDLH